tara:strand:+ start:5903 stop:6094 length:192 start_codon:yes stop_codon:yes gene_type:complete
MPEEFPIFLTHSELTNLNRIFNIIGEEALKANYFTKADIADVYSVLEKVRITKDEAVVDEVAA